MVCTLNWAEFGEFPSTTTTVLPGLTLYDLFLRTYLMQRNPSRFWETLDFEGPLPVCLVSIISQLLTTGAVFWAAVYEIKYSTLIVFKVNIWMQAVIFIDWMDEELDGWRSLFCNYGKENVKNSEKPNYLSHSLTCILQFQWWIKWPYFEICYLGLNAWTHQPLQNCHNR